MKVYSKKIFILLGLLIMAPISVNAATVNLNASISNNAVKLDLIAGTYNVTPTSDQYTAWNAWGTTKSCNDSGKSCRKGWINNYSITTPTETIFSSDHVRYATPELALMNALSTSFTLLTDATVTFFISDKPYTDNLGGISLNVSQVPIPAAAFLFAPALLGFMGLRRKAKNTVA